MKDQILFTGCAVRGGVFTVETIGATGETCVVGLIVTIGTSVQALIFKYNFIVGTGGAVLVFAFTREATGMTNKTFARSEESALEVPCWTFIHAIVQMKFFGGMTRIAIIGCKITVFAFAGTCIA